MLHDVGDLRRQCLLGAQSPGCLDRRSPNRLGPSEAGRCEPVEGTGGSISVFAGGVDQVLVDSTRENGDGVQSS